MKRAAREVRRLVVLAADGSDDLAGHLTQLGADVVVGDLFEDVGALLKDDEEPRMLIVDVGERPDLAGLAIRHARRDRRFLRVPVIVGVSERQVGSLDPAQGHDDFVALPCGPAELYGRVRALEWKRSEFSSDERTKVGPIVIDRASHEVTHNGQLVALTAREFSLLSFLAANRGRVFSRDQLLTRVWGGRYEGGARTVDIHVRRLRAKLGEAFGLQTLRGAGYVLRTPEEEP
jgi:DNA-binding response OmpR family regulator